MIEILKTQDDKSLKELTLNEAESGSWFNLINPTYEEIQKVSIILDLEEDFIRNSLDADELSRIEYEEGNLLVIINVPIMDDERNFDTLPLGLIFTHEGVITVCAKDNKIINSFNSETSKFFDTRDKTKFMLNILFRTAKYYLRYLKIINKQTEEIEHSLRTTTNNKALFKLIEAQKSLVYFTTALKDNRVVLEKILKSVNAQSLIGIIKFSEDDIDMLEDVIIETRQAEEMVEMHRTILESMMDGFASIINNNVNQVMKFLAAITIILSIPTMLGSFWGMNVQIPFSNEPLGFVYVIVISIIGALAATIFLFSKKGMY